MHWGAALLVISSSVLADPVPFRDCGTCPELMVIPAGTQDSGAPLEQGLRYGTPPDLAELEQPVTPVTITRPFAVGVAEVSVAEYRRFSDATSRAVEGSCFVFDEKHRRWEKRPEVTWQAPGFAQADDEPVVCVSWFDALDYTLWLTALTGKPYRLLTEDEWEYAARAGSSQPWPFGDDPALACDAVNVSNPGLPYNGPPFPCDDGFQNTAPPVWFPKNEFGLVHMIGNVWEWTATCFSLDDAGRCTQRINRGGSFADPVWRTRAAFREWDPPTGKYAIHGFRVARNIDEGEKQ